MSESGLDTDVGHELIARVDVAVVGLDYHLERHPLARQRDALDKVLTPGGPDHVLRVTNLVESRNVEDHEAVLLESTTLGAVERWGLGNLDREAEEGIEDRLHPGVQLLAPVLAP